MQIKWINKKKCPFTLTLVTLQEYDLVMKKCLDENINLGLDLAAWTQSLVIDFWRSATFRQHTRATLQEYYLVMKKCKEENIDFGLDSEAWPQSLVIDFWRSATFRQHTRATLQNMIW